MKRHNPRLITGLVTRVTLCFTLILLTCCERTPALEVFDVKRIPKNADLVTIDLSHSRLSGDATRHRLPAKIEASFVCHGKRVHLQLKHYPEKYRDSQNNVTGDGLPVYTRRNMGKGRNRFMSSPIVLDNFPRLFAQSCQTYRDYNYGASLIGIQDPVFGSVKFFGSFTVDGIQYFLQPLAVDRNSNGTTLGSGRGAPLRYHVMEAIPVLDFTGELAKVLSPGTESSFRNPRNAGSSGSPTPAQPRSERLTANTKEIRNEEIAMNHIFHTDKNVKQKRGRRNKKKRQRLLAKRNKSKKKDSAVVTKEISSSSRAATFNQTRRSFAIDTPIVEVFIVCDFLCYQRFQELYSITDRFMTMNVISQFFVYVQEYYRTTYSTVEDNFPELSLAIEVRVVGLFIATDVLEKIIGDYTIGDNNEVDSRPSTFEFALWVQDSFLVSLQADHYALVTGYDLSGESSAILGIVSNIPNVCQIDRVSLNELLLPATALVMSHELGHSLGAQHDGLTNGVCQDGQQFVMATEIGGPVPEQNVGNPYRFSECSAVFFKAELPDQECLTREDFQGSPLPGNVPPIGQEISLDQQCAAFFDGSYACRERIVNTARGSWDGICSNNLCSLPALPGLCFAISPLQSTSCGNRRWCENGVCIDTPQAPEKPVDCPAGDSPIFTCDVNLCASTYNQTTRFINCCDTCRPIMTERFVIISDQ